MRLACSVWFLNQWRPWSGFIGRFQNRSDWNDRSFRDWSQSQFNYHDQVPHHGWDFHYAGGTYVPHQTSGPTTPAVAPVHQPQPVACCKICDVKLGSCKNVEAHNNGKKHRRMLNLHEELQRLRISNGQIPNSQMNLVVQPKTVLKSGKNGCLGKNVSSEATIAKQKNYLQKDTGVTSEVPAEGKARDNTGAQGHKRKIGGAKTGKYMKTNDGVRRPMDSSKLDINSLSDSIASPVQIPALTLHPAVTSHRMASTPVVGSSFKLPYQHVSASQTQVLGGKEYHEIQNPTVETNDQPHAPADSNINTQPEDVNYDSAARAIRPPKVAYCKICEVQLPTCKINELEIHNNGKRHQRMLKLHEELQRLKSSNGQIPNSQKKLVVQPKTVRISGKNRHPPKNMSSGASISKHKNYLPKDMGLTSEIPAKGPKRKPRDKNDAQGHGFKYKIIGVKTGKYLKTNDGVRRPMESSKLNINSLSKTVESPVQKSIPALAPLPGPVASQIMAPTLVVGSSFELQLQHVSASQIHISEGKEHHEIQNPTVEMTDQPHAPADSNINTQTEDMSLDSTAVAMASSEGFMASQVFAPSPAVGSSFEPQIQHVLQTEVSESKVHNEVQNPTAETNDQPQSISLELHAPVDSNINTRTDVSSDTEAIAIGPPKGLMESHAFELSPAVGSSFEPQIQHVLQTEVSESKVHNEVQNRTAETNDQPQLISLELHAPIGSDINTQTNVSSDTEAIAIGPPKGLTESHAFELSPAVGSSFEPQIQHVLQTEVSENKMHNEVQNPTAETNDQPQSISVELHAPTGSDISTQTEDVTSDSAAVAIGPACQVSIPPTAVGSSFEPQIQQVLHIETEPQLSKDTTDCESQNCTDEKNNQLLPSVVVEFNSPSGSCTNTQTADGCSKGEQNMDILTDQSGTTQLSQVAVCLKCGDVGFPKTRVFCKKCQVYALHRYCLDGPVIFTDDVTWFCEDCEPKIVDTSFHDQCTLLPSGKNVSLNSAKDASQARTESKDCVERVKNKKQKPRSIAAKSKELLSDNHSLSRHGLSQCSNNSKKEKKFEKKCQPVPRDQASTSEGSMIVTVPQPIADPVWRGSLHLIDPSFGTVIGLLAHISTLACSKVLEETRLFPDVLCPDLLQRSAVWPKSFMKCGPDEESIALYFFPDTESVERAFDKLVDDMITFDLAIRAVVENAELLIFPSILLPVQHRRFQEKYYLWGVFRSKKTSDSTNDALCGEVARILTSP
ncbi:serine/arginine repetitive matrix protein 2 [Spatholobus suberectus]|nr:serine/arginine repetitive matrix protein 2 [Spatholobus suberectus]